MGLIVQIAVYLLSKQIPYEPATVAATAIAIFAQYQKYLIELNWHWQNWIIR